MVLQDLRCSDRHSVLGPFCAAFGLEKPQIQQDGKNSRNGAGGGDDLLFDRRLYQGHQGL